MGEQDARGWKNARPVSIEPLVEAPTASLENITDSYARWSAIEQQSDARHRHPARASDFDGQDQDPYRVVLFDDLRPLLFDVQTAHGRTKLIYSVLQLLGLSVRDPESSTQSALLGPPFGYYAASAMKAFGVQEAERRQSPRSAMREQALESERGTTVVPVKPDTPIKNWVPDLNTSFKSDWFKDLDASAIQHSGVDFIRYVSHVEMWICRASANCPLATS